MKATGLETLPETGDGEIISGIIDGTLQRGDENGRR
jgi:hypothetical protein